jgi:hypothetical protein
MAGAEQFVKGFLALKGDFLLNGREVYQPEPK